MTQTNAKLDKKAGLTPGQTIWYTGDFLTDGICQVTVVEYSPQKISPTDRVRRHDQVKVLANFGENETITLYKPHWHVTKEEAFARIQEIMHLEQVKLLQAQYTAVQTLLAAQES
jgi:hypothetical protein